jgi:hypothetical protein
MPEVMGLTGEVLPIPFETTRKVPTIPIEGIVPREVPAPKRPDAPSVPKTVLPNGQFGEQR